MAAGVDRRRVLAAGTGFALLALSGCGRSGPAFGSGPAEGTTVVTMGLTRYAPDSVAIEAGGTVEWRNTSIITHTVTTEADRAANPDRVRIPDGAVPFHSGPVAPGQIFRHRFDLPGEYVYFCVPHEQLGMWGRVIVRPAAPVAA
jgi:plastocyanin